MLMKLNAGQLMNPWLVKDYPRSLSVMKALKNLAQPTFQKALLFPFISGPNLIKLFGAYLGA